MWAGFIVAFPVLLAGVLVHLESLHGPGTCFMVLRGGPGAGHSGARSQPSVLPILHRAPSRSRSQPELWGEACVFSVMKNGLYKTRNSQGDGHVGIEPAQSLLIGSCQKQSVYS